MVKYMIITLTVIGSMWAREEDPFRQLTCELPSPNSYRTASGAPGEAYWQQQADYDIAVELNDLEQRIYGIETITYHNNAPQQLNYLWLQLDQNILREDADKYLTKSDSLSDTISEIKYRQLTNPFEGGFHIEFVRDGSDNELEYRIHKTMLQIILLKPMNHGDSFSIKIKWWYPINNKYNETWPSRTGYEYFPETENYIYSIAQFYPRMAAYYDRKGWQHNQYLGDGEFALEFGNFKVRITLPANYVVAATGTLKNAGGVLTAEQRKRLEKARSSSNPLFIITPEEARKNELTRTKAKTTWMFEAEKVRDFAFAASRQFIWDARGVQMRDHTVMAMSFYAKEAMPLWDQYATRAIAHTLINYSKYTFDYPYPVAIAVQTGPAGGMEYPMICFNGGRPNKDGVYSESMKHKTLSVIIHEIGHNYFPMIVNSDERQWAWMDEGINTFLEYLTSQAWEKGFPSKRVPVKNITQYLSGANGTIRPVMTKADDLLKHTNTAYSKPASALNILREVVLGEERYDFAFRTYANRWMFKRPTPADFFRTMEDASGFDLDWFWRGWFFSTDWIDLSIDTVKCFEITSDSSEAQHRLYYQITVSNSGSLVTPLIIKFIYSDQSNSILYIPAEIWRYNSKKINKIVKSEKEIESIIIDPEEQLGDINTGNNYWQGRLKAEQVSVIK